MSSIFGDLFSALLLNKTNINYNIYSIINKCRKNYFMDRFDIRYYIYKMRDLVNLVINFVK